MLIDVLQVQLLCSEVKHNEWRFNNLIRHDCIVNDVK